MLFGTERVRNLIYSDLKQVEQEYNITVVFGATVDGVAMGVTKYSSDLDLRFCFLYNNHDELCAKDYQDEGKIRIRVQYEQNAVRPYNAITLWEVHAFFHFLVEPRINQGYKYRLASIVYETFCSPYLYDPWGLHAMISPFFYRAYPIESEERYLCTLLKKFCEKEEYTLADTMKYLIRYMRLIWIREYHTLPPLSIYSLLPVQSRETSDLYDFYLKKLHNWSIKQQNKDDWTKDMLIEQPKEICQLFRNEIIDSEFEIDYSLFARSNQEVECVMHVLQNVAMKYPPQLGGFFWSDDVFHC